MANEKPELAVQAAIMAYLKMCKLGNIRRVNAGKVRVGDKPKHPWAKDTRRFVSLAEPGHSDLVLELANSPVCVFIEVKAPGGKPTPLQLAFLARQRQRGNLGFVAWSVRDVYDHLTAKGFQGLPLPGGAR